MERHQGADGNGNGNGLGHAPERRRGVSGRGVIGCVEELQTAASRLLLPLQVTAKEGRPFRARVDAVEGRLVRAGLVRSTPHTVCRAKRVMSSSDPDLFKVTLHRQGGALVTQDGVQRPVAAGELLVLDTSRAYTMVLPEQCDVVVFSVPRGLFGPHARAVTIRSGCAIAVDAGAMALCAAVLSAMGDNMGALTAPRAALSMTDSLTGLLVSALAEVPPERVELPGLSMLDRIKAYAVANIGDECLSGTAVARAHHMSLRSLQQVFKEEGETFTGWLRAERLERIRLDLGDPGHRATSAVDIAKGWGIRDTGHLSRLLRERLGVTVAELREGGGGAGGEGEGLEGGAGS
ncbi:helix-turn-helix domain-containing protein [Streptomyces sp. NPDC050145]|uniref:AraC-like ligand-binding domain-containing protein n=1 Tax=Streptomyces sp. NPDC050145 TaxID=3365602 RepID=UPI0037A017BF